MKTLVTLVLTSLALSLLAAPAHADQRSFRDKDGDIAYAGADIKSVTVKHRKKQISVTINVADLPKQDFTTSYLVWIDTNNKKKAPNYLVAVDGSHALFGSTKGWTIKTSSDAPFGDVDCSTGYKYDRKNDRVIFRFKPRCIGGPAKIRIAVTTVHWEQADVEGGFTSSTDHLVKSKRFTRWVRR